MSDAETSTLAPASLRRYVRLGRKRVRVGMTRLALDVTPSPRPFDTETALAGLPSSPRVLVVCLGNICRSPMAERYLRAEADARGLSSFTVESGGFVETEERPSPANAVAAAEAYGVDLDEHRSRTVTEPMVHRSDLVLLMDAYNYALFRDRFESTADRARFLARFGPSGDYEIADPHGADAEEFRHVFGRIAASIDALLDQVERERR